MIKKGLVFISLLLFNSSYIYTEYTPILMDRSELESSISMAEEAKVITNPGKICLYRQWVLLVENYKGIHLIDNTDPTNPVRRDFIRIPGCRDVAVGNGILYVDNAVDLVGIYVDFNALTAKEVSRKVRVLPEIASPDGYIPYSYSRRNRPDNTEIIGWLSVETTNSPNYYE